jgi:predicted ATPase
MFAYLTLLYDPNPHPLLCVEEPENQLYPKLLWELAEEFRPYAYRGGQVIVSTHFPDFLNAATVEEVFKLTANIYQKVAGTWSHVISRRTGAPLLIPSA